MPKIVAIIIAAKAKIAVCGIAAEIKWPNDILIGGKKVCGILTEMSAEMDCVRHVILGDPRGSIRAARTIDETAADTIARQSLIDRIVARSA